MGRKFYLGTFILTFLMFVNQLFAQTDTSVVVGVKVKVPSKEKKNTSYIFLTGGYQNPAWYRVPVIPEFPVNMEIKGDKVRVPGWFAGIGIMKKTRTKFEVGILADFYKSTIPVAFSGQRSTGDWVLEQSANTTAFTDVFSSDINRVSEVIAIRASIRYKIPAGNFQFWGGIAPGTFSSKVYFSESGFNDALKTYVQTSAGLSFQAGVNLIVKNAQGKDMLRFSFYSDFSSPKIEEKMIGLFKPSWKFINSDGNYAISPVRFGFAIGIH
jgi:hypothetical protein